MSTGCSHRAKHRCHRLDCGDPRKLIYTQLCHPVGTRSHATVRVSPVTTRTRLPFHLSVSLPFSFIALVKRVDFRPQPSCRRTPLLALVTARPQRSTRHHRRSSHRRHPLSGRPFVPLTSWTSMVSASSSTGSILCTRSRLRPHYLLMCLCHPLRRVKCTASHGELRRHHQSAHRPVATHTYLPSPIRDLIPPFSSLHSLNPLL